MTENLKVHRNNTISFAQEDVFLVTLFDLGLELTLLWIHQVLTIVPHVPIFTSIQNFLNLKEIAGKLK